MYANETPLEAFGITPVDGQAALELEVEGRDLPSYNNASWVSHTDGSLRLGGMEYVSNGPRSFDKLKDDLIRLNANLENKTVYESDRTSVHVHLNMQDKTFLDIVKGAVAYYVIEPALMEYCGPVRKDNLFCLPMHHATGQMEALKKFSGVTTTPSLRGAHRYSALNLYSLQKFGSIEHRGMRGYYEPEFLTEWAYNLNNIWEVAKDFKTPVEVLDNFYGRQKREYLGTFLTPKFVDKLSKIKDYDALIGVNNPRLASFLYKHEFVIWEYNPENYLPLVVDTGLGAIEYQIGKCPATIKAQIMEKKLSIKKIREWINNNYCIDKKTKSVHRIHDLKNKKNIPIDRLGIWGNGYRNEFSKSISGQKTTTPNDTFSIPNPLTLAEIERRFRRAMENQTAPEWT